MATSFKVNVKVGGVKELATAIGRAASNEVLGKAQIVAVNKVADRAYNQARQRMGETVNLDDTYIRRKLAITNATDRPRATITAAGDNVVLGRYNPKLRLRPVRDLARAKGSAKRGIAPGLTGGGVSVEVKRGRPAVLETGFLLPLRRGNEAGGNGMGVFTRDKQGRVKHRYGPSVYQIFSSMTRDILEEVQDDLQETVLREMDAAIEKVLP